MKPWSKNQFRFLLVIYLVIVAATFAIESRTRSLIPKPVLDSQEIASRTAISRYTQIQRITYIALATGVLLAGLVGLIGMFVLSRIGLYIFLTAVCVRTLLSPMIYSWHVSTGWKVLFSETSLILEGVIFAVAFLGPAKQLFGQSEKA